MGMTEHPRIRELEAYAVARDDAAIAAHVRACATCGEQIAAIEREREALLHRLPAHTFVAAVAARRAAADRRARSRRWLGGSAIACAAAAAVLWLAPTTGVRAKGVGVEVFRKRGERVERFGDGDRVRAGDGLRVSLVLPAAQHATVSFVDARGHVDAYPEGDRDFPAGTTVLPGVTIDPPCIDLTLVIATRDTRLARKLPCE
jgi:hypothetical protein